MIYIEVIFGAINGNALDVDSALSRTSTNPVQNKVIAAALDLLQRNIDAVADDRVRVAQRKVDAFAVIGSAGIQHLSRIRADDDLVLFIGVFAADLPSE